MEKPDTSRNRLLKFFSNPILGICGSLASIFSIFLAVIFYYNGREYPVLTYYVNPAKTIIMRDGQSSMLKAIYNNKPIETDITAAQIAIWNNGKRSIRRENVLKPLVIYTENNASILEATIRRVSREVIKLDLGTDELPKGRVKVLWNILEKNDGGVIQLIYSGDTNVNLYAEGIIEGQSEIHQIKAVNRTSIETQRKLDNIKGGILIGFGIIYLILFIYFHVKEKTSHRKDFDWSLLLITIIYILLGGCLLLLLKEPVPPFGF